MDTCPDFWTQGCGPLDSVFSATADVLECISPFAESIAAAIWCCGSPVAFPLIYCFPPDPHTDETSGWEVSMQRAPAREPLMCCFSMICFPCGQFIVRRRALGGDMSRYKLWQGYHDGPHCLARHCDGAPITIESGTYEEHRCPNVFLCLEVTVLGGPCSSCCAFDASRRLMKEERDLGTDPTEARQEKCMEFTGDVANSISRWACCIQCAGCCVGCCATDSDGAQECSAEAKRASRACWSIAHTLYKGMWAVKIIAIGCMSSQMIHEDKCGRPILVKDVPSSMKMERSGDNCEEHGIPSVNAIPEDVCGRSR
ncbi:hypothetical protein HJC23_011437 [Cyclotella cryptica]|uniref:Phospholipid scramblase n=1 Tax=Cyclotella cryptica TaxID=29204 RepID=A0ABD3P1N2_9STRA|eukprot:CCRYP_018207-RA/>CCRYP_018207-RA protein AED:0.08 eAED:0.08 QI:168/-1/1/1/-1/1/1/257/312